MDDYYLLIFVAGVLIGWLTKIPFFLKWYDEWQIEKLEIYQTQKRIIEMMKRGDIEIDRLP